MFEFDQYEQRRQTAAPARPSLNYQGVRATDLESTSFLIWGEHCIECAAPACYSSCDLYAPRPDGRCRRFSFGAFRNTAFSSIHDYGAEITFKKWGKLEARGNLTLVPVRRIRKLEKAAVAGFHLANALGRAVTPILRDKRWSYLSHVLHEKFSRKAHTKFGREESPDAFLLEVYNPGDKTVNLQITVTGVDMNGRRDGLSQIAAAFRTTAALPPGYSRHDFDYRVIRSAVKTAPAFDISLTPETESEVRLVFLSADFVKFAKGAATADATRKDVKCVVWDLDNTIWDGVLLENPNVQLRPGIRDILQYLDERGILLSIASKNDHESAWTKLQEFGLADLFLYPQINWMPKSENVKRIAELLDIGIDTFAFVDDNPFELAEVGQSNPDVECVHIEQIDTIPTHPRMQGSTTMDARSRRMFYQQAIVREQEESRFGDNYVQFLASCSISLDVVPYTPDDLDRIAELVQRTNQLNFSGRKYSRNELYDVLDNNELEKYVLKCSDRYGSYGTIGFSIVRPTPAALRVEDFMVSCRVQGKFLEQAFFDHLLQHHNPYGTPELRVAFKPTSRNKPAQKVLETIGFDLRDDGSGITARTSLACDFIQVQCSIPHSVNNTRVVATGTAESG